MNKKKKTLEEKSSRNSGEEKQCGDNGSFISRKGFLQ